MADTRIIRLASFLFGGVAVDGALGLEVDEQLGKVLSQSDGELGATAIDIVRRDVKGVFICDNWNAPAILLAASALVNYAEFNFYSDGNNLKDLLIGKSGQSNGIIFTDFDGGVTNEPGTPLIWRLGFRAVYNPTNTKFLASAASEYDTGNTALAKIDDPP